MIIGPARIVTGGPEPRVIEDGGVRVAGAHIAQVGPIGALAASYRDETVWPAGGRLLLPGLVNAHAHLARHLGRGRGLEKPSDWERYDRALSPEDVRWAALAALVEGVRHGVTTTCDLHRSGSFVDFSLCEVADAATKLGVRVATAYAAHEKDSTADRRAALDESLGLGNELSRSRQGRVRALLGMRAQTPAGLAQMIETMEDSAGADVGFHVELESEGRTPAQWPLHASERPSLWAHAEHAWSELRPGDGGHALAVAAPGAPLWRRLEMAWGSDAGVNAPPVLDDSNARGDAARLHYQRVFASGARWAEQVFGEGLGVLDPGAPADLILVDYQPATELEPATLFAHLAACVGRAAVSGAMVAGEIVLDHGVFVTVDEAEVSARARQCARRVWQRL